MENNLNIESPQVQPVEKLPHDTCKQQTRTSRRAELIAAIIVVAIGSLLLSGFRIISARKPQAPVVTGKLLPYPSPTSARLPSLLASQGAFLKFVSDVASLSASISNYVVDDPSLSPPVLQLPLGFQ